MPRFLQAELLTPVAAEVGEGPQWDAVLGVLSWVDITVGRVHVCSALGEGLRTYEIGRAVGAALPAEGGGFLLAEANGFSILSASGATSPLLPMLEDKPLLRFNDAKCDPAGRAFGGTVAYDKTPGAGNLYRLDAGPIATSVLNGLTVSNGLGWSPDARTMWLADSAQPCIMGFDYEIANGSMGARCCVLAVQETSGVPDGLCVDDEGGVWLALWGGNAVHRYLPDGRLDTIVRVPTPHVTSCAFGGPDLSTLFITTARRGLAEEQQRREPTAGGIFAVEPGVTGPAATRWRLDLLATTATK